MNSTRQLSAQTWPDPVVDPVLVCAPVAPVDVDASVVAAVVTPPLVGLVVVIAPDEPALIPEPGPGPAPEPPVDVELPLVAPESSEGQPAAIKVDANTTSKLAFNNT